MHACIVCVVPSMQCYMMWGQAEADEDRLSESDYDHFFAVLSAQFDLLPSQSLPLAIKLCVYACMCA